MTSILIAIGLVPFFSGRTLLTTGLVISWYFAVSRGPQLTVSGVVILVLGSAVSCALEYGLTKLKPWARELLTASLTFSKHTLDYVKTAAAMFCALALLGETGSRVEMLAALIIVGGLGLLFARLRTSADEIFEALPVAQIPGVGLTMFLAEVGATLAGVALVFVAPVVGVLLMLVALVMLAIVALALKRFREGARETCVCGASLHRCAVACAKCGAPHQARRVGWLGRPAKESVDDEARHRIVLLGGHRCPRCADGLSGDACRSCGPAFRDDAEFEGFVRYVDTRFAVLTPVIIGLGFVPVLGLAVALVTYKLSAAGAFAGYANWKGHLGVRVLRAVMLIGLALVQPVPLVGVGATWAFITLSHVWLRRTVHASRAAKAPAHA